MPLELPTCRSWSYYLHEPLRWAILTTTAALSATSALVSRLVPVSLMLRHILHLRAVHRGNFRSPGDVSPWHGGSEPSTGPVRYDGHTWRGLDSGHGHSVSYLRRQYLYSWFAGAGSTTAECCTCFAFTFRGQPMAAWPNNSETPYDDMELTTPHRRRDAS